MFPINAVVTPAVRNKLDELYIPPISELTRTWVHMVYSAGMQLKKSKNGKNFFVVKVIDDNNETTTIRCWGVDPDKDVVHINRPYMARLKYDPNWGSRPSA